MKILCEVPLRVEQYGQSQFHWLKGAQNYLFAIENTGKLRMFSIEQSQLEAGVREVQAASLNVTRQFTSLSWNKDESLLAVVLDKREIHIWDVGCNDIAQFKPRSMLASSSNPMVASARSSGGGGGDSHLGATSQQSRKATKSIECVAWSKLTNRLAICYASGQILLCEPETRAAASGHFSTTWERQISNSDSVLEQIVSIEVSEQAELFACFSASNEILIMTFDGRMILYNQGEPSKLFNAKFSPLKREHCPRTGQYLGQTICLAYQSEHDVLMLKKIPLDAELLELHQSGPAASIALNEIQHQAGAAEGTATPMVDFCWLTPTRLVICFASGSIQMVQLDATKTGSPTLTADGGRGACAIVQFIYPPDRLIQCTEALRLDAHLGRTSHDPLPVANGAQASGPEHSQRSEDSTAFAIFEVTRTSPRARDSSPGYALAIGTSYQLHYFGLTQEASGDFSFEHFDTIDLGESLRRVSLRLARARWTHDCSMLALQLTSGHLLVYRTRLQDFMVAAHGSRAAYLSAPNEVTILNYAREQADEATANGAQRARAADNAHILSVRLRPSLLAIGPRHLALALNNRVRFYLLDSLQQPTNGGEHLQHQEREYAAIVAGVGLCSRFAAVQFQDGGRLKLHSLRSRQSGGDDDDDEEERLFPDPSQPERIAAFALTEQLLVYSTRSCQLAVFCLKTWRLAQVCHHARLCAEPVWRLKPNVCGNKFVCLTEPGGGSLSSADASRQRKLIKPPAGRKEGAGVLLYDLYTNDVYAISGNLRAGEPLWPRLLARQLQLICASLPVDETTVNRLLKEAGLSHAGVASGIRMGGATDAIWDTDGRTVLIIEPKSIHALAVLDHTLEREGPIVEYAASARKPSSHTTLHVHQGIVSYQTSLGRVLNSILETHDDELKLTKLEMRIQAIKRTSQSAWGQHDLVKQGEAKSRLEARLEVMLLKVSYLCTLVPIYPLSKCRDICKHLMEDEAFNLDAGAPGKQAAELAAHRTIDAAIWQVLAAWSLFTLNLDFASLIYRWNNLWVHARMLAALLEDIKAGRSNVTRATVRERILTLLDFELGTTES